MPTPLSPFAGVAPSTLQAWLASAQTAYFKLSSGAGVAEVVTQGDVVKYRAADINQLQALIAQLQAALSGVSQGGAIGAIWAL